MTLLDISENMLKIARQRFAYRKNFTYIVSDYGRGIPPVRTIWSVQHSPSIISLRRTNKPFSGKYFLLPEPGGLFVNADQADGNTPYFRNRYLRVLE